MNMVTPKYPWLGLIVLLAICFAAAGIGGAVTTPKINDWYATLAKPTWNPPNWIFAPYGRRCTWAWPWPLGWSGGKADCPMLLGRWSCSEFSLS